MANIFCATLLPYPNDTTLGFPHNCTNTMSKETVLQFRIVQVTAELIILVTKISYVNCRDTCVASSTSPHTPFS